MSSLFMINCNRLMTGVQSIGLSSIAAILRKNGHQFELFDLAVYTPVLIKNSNNQKDVLQFDTPLNYKKISNLERMPSKRPLDLMLDDLIRKIEKTSPSVIGFSFFSDDWPFALFLIKKVKSRFPDIPVICGGVHATVAPDTIIKHPEVLGVCYSEGEFAVLKLLDGFDHGQIDFNINNMWFNKDGKIIKNDFDSKISFDDNWPFLDWSDCSDVHFIYPFEGRLYRRGNYFLSRGCPFSCNYCINNFFTCISKTNIRSKKVDFAIKELKFLKNKHDLEFIRFWDETFLAMPVSYLRDFATKYKEEIGLPFTIETTGNTISETKAKLLKEMGCLSVSIGVETSYENLRRGLLGKPVSNSQFDNAFEILKKYGIRSVANFMNMLPEQPEDDLYKSILACQKWGVDATLPRNFYPYIGTPLRDYIEEKKMLDIELLNTLENENRIQSLEDLSEVLMTFEDTVLLFPERRKKESTLLMNNFVLLVEIPQWMHSEVIELLKKELEDDKEAITVLQALRSMVYKKRFSGEMEEFKTDSKENIVSVSNNLVTVNNI